MTRTEKQMQQELTDALKRHDSTTTHYYGAALALPTADEARQLAQQGQQWQSELAVIALQIKEAATNGLTKIVLPAYPSDPVREKLRVAGYSMHSGPVGAYIDWSSHVYIAPGEIHWRFMPTNWTGNGKTYPLVDDTKY